MPSTWISTFVDFNLKILYYLGFQDFIACVIAFIYVWKCFKSSYAFCVSYLWQVWIGSASDATDNPVYEWPHLLLWWMNTVSERTGGCPIPQAVAPAAVLADRIPQTQGLWWSVQIFVLGRKLEVVTLGNYGWVCLNHFADSVADIFFKYDHH